MSVFDGYTLGYIFGFHYRIILLTLDSDILTDEEINAFTAINLSFFGICRVGGGIISGHIIDKYEKKKVLEIFIGLAGLGIFLIFVVYLTKSIFCLFVATGIIGFSENGL